MLIDWFTVIAQALNFLILLWLMKRFLFGPITSAIEARQTGISESLAEAARTKQAAEEERSRFEQERAELEKRRDDLLKEAVAAAAAQRKKLLDQAAKEAETVSKNRLEALRAQEEKLETALGERAREEAFSLAQDILRELSEEKLESRILETFLRRLEQLDEDRRLTLREAIENGEGEVLVRCAVELPPEARQTLEAGVERLLSSRIQWRYSHAPALLNGFELVAEGYKLSWSGAGLLEQVKTAASSVDSDHG